MRMISSTGLTKILPSTISLVDHRSDCLESQAKLATLLTLTLPNKRSIKGSNHRVMAHGDDSGL
jgi:hypothetical protein